MLAFMKINQRPGEKLVQKNDYAANDGTCYVTAHTRKVNKIYKTVSHLHKLVRETIQIYELVLIITKRLTGYLGKTII